MKKQVHLTLHKVCKHSCRYDGSDPKILQAIYIPKTAFEEMPHELELTLEVKE